MLSFTSFFVEGDLWWFDEERANDVRVTELTAISFPIPAATPSGDYLVRVEHIGLHGAGQSGGAQFYGSCGQVCSLKYPRIFLL